MPDMPVAIVTGAGRGIGRAVCLGLAADGYRVALVARTEADLRTVADQIAAAAGDPGDDSTLLLPLDVADVSAVEQAVATVRERFGRIDLLFNNAGAIKLGTLDLNSEDITGLYEVNLRGPFAFMRAVVPVMKQRQSGHIFNIASKAGKIGFAGCGAYSATKFGLVGISESVYRELAPHGIKVTALCPSWVDTDMARTGGTPLDASQMIQPDDIMNTIRWLLSLSPAACVRELVIECAIDVG